MNMHLTADKLETNHLIWIFIQDQQVVSYFSSCIYELVIIDCNVWNKYRHVVH